MSLPILNTPSFPKMPEHAIEDVRKLETLLKEMPQSDLATDHVFHAGLYARTICLPAGHVLTGALIKRSTLLIVSGDCQAFTGENTLRLVGYHVIPASAGRKQVFLAYENTSITMIFPTQAKTVEDAENEFTDEAHLLISREQGEQDSITITGE